MHIHRLQHLLQVLNIRIYVLFLLINVLKPRFPLFYSSVDQSNFFRIVFEQWLIFLLVGFVFLNELRLLFSGHVVELVLVLDIFRLLLIFLTDDRSGVVIAFKHLVDVSADVVEQLACVLKGEFDIVSMVFLSQEDSLHLSQIQLILCLHFDNDHECFIRATNVKLCEACSINNEGTFSGCVLGIKSCCR